jgi:CelD/BcsL family acetyltransferase involved in cellulose biosynthesis
LWVRLLPGAPSAQAVLNYLEEHSGEWDILEINELEMDSRETLSLLSHIRTAGHGLREDIEEHFYIPFTETWEQYHGRLSKNLKHNYKRRFRRAKEIGEVTIERYSGNELSWEHFQTIFKINENSNFPELYQSSENQAFHRDLFELMRGRNWIQIEILSIGNKPIAFQYGFLYNERYEDWRGGIDKDYEFIAPGKLLMMQSLESRFRTGFRENDFLRGKQSYKTDWLPLSRDFTSIQVFNKNNMKSRLAFIWTRHRKPASASQSDDRDG